MRSYPPYPARFSLLHRGKLSSVQASQYSASNQIRSSQPRGGNLEALFWRPQSVLAFPDARLPCPEGHLELEKYPSRLFRVSSRPLCRRCRPCNEFPLSRLPEEPPLPPNLRRNPCTT